VDDTSNPETESKPENNIPDTADHVWATAGFLMATALLIAALGKRRARTRG